MKTHTSKPSIQCILGILATLFLAACIHQHQLDLTGKWKEVEEKAILEFHEGSRFTAVDNMGMAVSGNYFLLDSNHIRFEIKHSEPSPEIIDAKIALQGDELILIFGDNKEVEKYERVQP